MHFLLILNPTTKKTVRVRMSQIWHRIETNKNLEDNICQDFGKNLKKVEGGSAEDEI